ncbi:type II secretion system F family protein [Candidatus Babeliales bacterium]|nr:type II secretion system F family protein [Candidatus Babeliales bacterium]
MIQNLKTGLSFQNSLNKHKNIFSPIMVQTVRIGEASGDLETVFFRLANYLSWKESFKKKLKQSLLLPFLTLGIGLVLMSVIFVFVIPQFEIILKSLDKPLPKLTLLTFAIANNFMPAVIIISLLTFFSFVIFRFYVDSKYKIQLDKFLFNLPVVGQLLHKLDLVRFVYALSLQLRCGVPLIESINNSKQNVRSLFFKNKFLDLIKLVQRGNSLEEALSLIGSTYFPKELIAIIAVGERSGKLIEMLDRAVFIFEEELNRVFETLTIIVQPCLIVLVGLIIGVLMIAVYMPIFAIGTGL